MERPEIHPIESEFTFYHKKAKIHEELLTEKMLGNKILTRENIRILTYNIFLRPPLVKNNESDWKDERLEDFLKLLHNYDIICLQEAFGMYNSRKLQLIRAANKNGFFYFLDLEAPPFYSKFLADGGLLILSRFPILKHSTYYYNYGVVSDSLAQKSVLYAQIEIGSSKLHLFTTHTQASYNNDLVELFIASFNTRLDQIDQMARFIREVLKYEMNDNTDLALLCGDLNVDALGYNKLKKNLSNPILIRLVETEYEKMLEVINENGLLLENLFYKIHGYHPITYGEYDEKSGYFEQVLTHRDDLGCCQCLDYIFALKVDYNHKANIPYTNDNKSLDNGRVFNGIEGSNADYYQPNQEGEIVIDTKGNSILNVKKMFDLADINDTKKSLYIIPESVVVIKHLISEMNFCEHSRVYTQLSDHYGLSCLIKYNEQNYQKNTVLIVKSAEEIEDELNTNSKVCDTKESKVKIDKIKFNNKESEKYDDTALQVEDFKESDSFIERY